MSVRRAQREIDAREFAEWIAFFGIETEGVRPRRQTPEEMYAVFSSFAAAHNAYERR